MTSPVRYIINSLTCGLGYQDINTKQEINMNYVYKVSWNCIKYNSNKYTLSSNLYYSSVEFKYFADKDEAECFKNRLVMAHAILNSGYELNAHLDTILLADTEKSPIELNPRKS